MSKCPELVNTNKVVGGELDCPKRLPACLSCLHISLSVTNLCSPLLKIYDLFGITIYMLCVGQAFCESLHLLNSWNLKVQTSVD